MRKIMTVLISTFLVICFCSCASELDKQVELSLQAKERVDKEREESEAEERERFLNDPYLDMATLLEILGKGYLDEIPEGSILGADYSYTVLVGLDEQGYERSDTTKSFINDKIVFFATETGDVYIDIYNAKNYSKDLSDVNIYVSEVGNPKKVYSTKFESEYSALIQDLDPLKWYKIWFENLPSDESYLIASDKQEKN